MHLSILLRDRARFLSQLGSQERVLKAAWEDALEGNKGTTAHRPSPPWPLPSLSWGSQLPLQGGSHSASSPSPSPHSPDSVPAGKSS